MTESAWEYLCKLRELPFEQFLEWRMKRDGLWLAKTKRANGIRGRATPPKELK